MFATVFSSHEVPDRPAIQISVGEQVSVGQRSPDWPAFVFVTSALGEGWVPSRHLSAEEGVATVEADYDTAEIAGGILTWGQGKFRARTSQKPS